MKKAHLIIAGNAVPEDWEFQKGLEESSGRPWEVRRWIINRYDGLHRFTRYVKYFINPLWLVAHRGRWSEILSWEQFFGIVMVAYMRLLRIKACPKIYIMTFIYRQKSGAVGRLYERFIRYAVSSGYISKIYVFGKSEIAYYARLFGVEESLFSSEVLGVADLADAFPAADMSDPAKARTELYSVAPGRSNRDYDFVRAAWPKDREKLYVVCDVETAQDSDNIVYLRDCHGDDYRRLLSGARTVLVPLRSQSFSSGQLVFIESAMLGKPVITTWNDTIIDYVEDGVTGLVIEKTPQALSAALAELDDPRRYRELSRNAREKFEREFSLYELGRRIGSQIGQ